MDFLLKLIDLIFTMFSNLAGSSGLVKKIKRVFKRKNKDTQ
ncbi:hypothetical protein ACWEYQ_01855 [Staphylococcus xylosus]